MDTKTNVPNVVFDLKWTPIFEWCVVKCESGGGGGGGGEEEELDYVLKIC